MFSSLAVLSVFFLFFTKNALKASLLFANAFLCSSLVCIMFRQPAAGIAVLLSGALCSYIYLRCSALLEKDIVRAKGATPKFLKLFSILCCAAFFFAVMSSVPDLKDTPDLPYAADKTSQQAKKSGSAAGIGIYLLSLAAISALCAVPGRKMLCYKDEKAAADD